MSFQINQIVELNGKEYKIVGTVARSFLLEREGKTYRATADKLTKIQNQNSRQAQASSTPPKSVLAERVRYAQLFDKTAKMPETEEEIAAYFEWLRGDLSPENLSCDGEASTAHIAMKKRSIALCWKELEAKLGRRVAV